MCDACLKRDEPPHKDYLQQILGQILHGTSSEGVELADIVAEFAYPIYANPGLGFCYRCDSSWVDWTCQVCDFPIDQEKAYMQMLSFEDIMGYEPTGRDAEKQWTYERADIAQWHRHRVSGWGLGR